MPAQQLGDLGQLAARDLDAGRLGSRPQAPGDPLQHRRVGALDRQVVEQGQRLGAHAHQVVHVHGHAVDADRVEAPGLLGHDHLRAHAVRAQRDAQVGRHLQHRRVVAGRQDRARRAPGVDPAQNAHERGDRAVGGVLVHAGPGVGVRGHRPRR